MWQEEGDNWVVGSFIPCTPDPIRLLSRVMNSRRIRWAGRDPCVGNMRNEQNIMTCIPNARQRLGKHIPAGANASNNRMATARQRISKHASLTIEAVCSAWSVQSGYIEVSGSIEKYRTVVKKVDSRVSRRQPARIWAWE
jgi:hypothetical protein